MLTPVPIARIIPVRGVSWTYPIGTDIRTPRPIPAVPGPARSNRIPIASDPGEARTGRKRNGIRGWRRWRRRISHNRSRIISADTDPDTKDNPRRCKDRTSRQEQDSKQFRFHFYFPPIHVSAKCVPLISILKLMRPVAGRSNTTARGGYRPPSYVRLKERSRYGSQLP